MATNKKIVNAGYDKEVPTKYGTRYQHLIKIEGDEKIYEYLSVDKEQKKFIPGQASWFNLVEEHGHWKIKPEKAPEGQQQSSTQSYQRQPKSPEEQKRISKQVAYEVAIGLLQGFDVTDIAKGNDYVIANKLTAWLIEKGTGDDNKAMMASKALRMALMTLSIPPLIDGKGKASEKLIDKANEIFNYFITI